MGDGIVLSQKKKKRKMENPDNSVICVTAVSHQNEHNVHTLFQ